MEEGRPSKLIIVTIGQLGNGRILIQIHSFLTPNSLSWKHCTSKSMTCTHTIIRCEETHTKNKIKKEKKMILQIDSFVAELMAKFKKKFLLRLF